MSPEIQPTELAVSHVPTAVQPPLASGHLPDPSPFDVDGYFNEWNKSQNIERMADNHNAFTGVVHSFAKPFIAQGYNTMSSLNRGVASFYAHLDSVADFVEASGMGKKEGLFDKLSKISSENADYWRERAEKVGIGFLDELVSEAVGGFVPGVTQFATDVASGFTFPYMAGAAEGHKKGEQPFSAGILEAAKTGTLSGLFKMLGPLKTYLKAPTMGTIFGIQEMEGAPEGEKAKAFAKGALIGAGYAMTSPGGRLGLNEIAENLRPEIEKVRQNAEFIGKVLKSERGAIGEPPEKEETRPRKFIKTVEEAAETAPEIKERLEKMPEEAKDYYVQPNKESLEKADLRIQVEGLDKTVDYAMSNAELNAEKGATFIRLMERFQGEGDFDRAVQMVEAYDTQLREAGRFVQAASIWNKLTPGGFVRWAEKQLETTKSKYSWVDTVFGNKPEDFTLTKDEKTEIFKKMTEINKMPEGIEKTDATLEMIDSIAKKVPPSVNEIIDAYRYQNMLSSPRTHMRNIGENIFNTFMTRPFDLTTRGAYDWVKSTLTGKEREAYISDVPAYLKASVNAVPNALEGFISTYKQKQGSEIKKPELGIEVKNEFERARSKEMPAVLTIVQRFMEASDKFNSALISAGEFEIQKKRGATDSEAYEKSKALAEKYLYRDKLDPNDTDLSYFSKVLSSLGKTLETSRKMPGLSVLSKWYVPFLKTPINKGIQMIEHSPLGIARSEFDKEAMAKIVAGSVVTGIGAMFAMNGDTTWAPPTDQKEKEWFYASGRKPFSVKIGDKWIPFWYLGPYALAFGLPAAAKHYSETQKQALTRDGYDKLLKTAEGVAQFIGSQTSSQSIGALFSAVGGDIDYNVLSQTAFTAEQIIPGSGLVRYINTILDPVYRKPNGFIEQIEKDLPLLSEKLESRKTPYLETSERESQNYFLPYDVGTVKPEYEVMLPLERYKLRQGHLERKMNDLITKTRKGELTPEESLKEIIKIMKASPKSLEQLGEELEKQGGSK